MRIAYVHVLPLEYYPPAINTLELLAREAGWEVRAWSSRNLRDSSEWSSPRVHVERPALNAPGALLPFRITGYLNWHFPTARDIARWKPHVVMSVEPHSALATWMYYRMFSGGARLFIHHHEYYAAADFSSEGMRLLRATRKLERNDLWRRAEWISQTNVHRLRLLRESTPAISEHVGHVYPNYPPLEWGNRAKRARRPRDDSRIRFLYLGSASLEDAFIAEAAEWIASRPDETSLHVVGNNIASDVWAKLRSLGASNITLDDNGWNYDAIPEHLADFDIGLILYRGNTQNFIYNVPNKAIEYLAGELEVWYPREMRGLADFHASHPDLRMREMNFSGLPTQLPALSPKLREEAEFPFTAEAATAPLIAAIAKTS